MAPLESREFLSHFDGWIFDLDGTLVDSLEDIAAGIERIRATRRLAPLSLEAVRRRVGHGVRRLVAASLPDDSAVEDLEAAIAEFTDYYGEHSTHRTRLYPGVRDALEALSATGKLLAVLTNKPEALARRVLDGLDLSRSFDVVTGGDTLATRKPDPAGLLDIVRRWRIPLSRTVLIGDSEIDVETARAAGVCAVGVLYGFHPEELRTSRPDVLVGDLRELLE
jgi:phosphoglycolate phosphatase